MNPSKDSGTQLSLLSDVQQSRPACANARMATHVLQRMLDQNGSIAPSSAVFFKAVFPAAIAAAEQSQGLPVTKTTLRPHLIDPAAAISLRPPTRPDEFAQMETLLEFVQHRLGSATEKAKLDKDIELLLGQMNPEMLITPEGMPSQLFASDRTEAAQIFQALPEETCDALVEAYVLLRANHADVQSGIAGLFWRQNTGSAPAEHYVEACADGQARAYFRRLLSLPEDKQQEVFNAVNLEVFYATLGSLGTPNG